MNKVNASGFLIVAAISMTALIGCSPESTPRSVTDETLTNENLLNEADFVDLGATPDAEIRVSGNEIASPPTDPAMGPVLEEELDRRRTEQIEQAKEFEAFNGFQFVDQHPESGIDFISRVVDDASKDYKAVHYDHGTGVAVADVDGDGLLDIYFATQIGSNKLYKNLGNGKFEDMTAQGLDLSDRVSVAVGFADLDNDGDPDLFVTTVRHGNVLFENLGNGQFRDVSKTAGVDYVGHSSGIVFLDYDRDGLLDIFVTNVGDYTHDETGEGGFFLGYEDGFHGHLFPERQESSILYRNEGGLVFRDVTETLGLATSEVWSGDASACDVNNDGYLDIYLLNMQGDDKLFINQGGMGFEESIATYFPKTSWGAMGIKFFDFNQDGHFDLFTTDMHSDMTTAQTDEGARQLGSSFEKRKSEAWCGVEWTEAFLQDASNNLFGNSFYLNDGQGGFSEVSQKMGAETYWPWGVSVGDVNADGFEDVFVTAGMGYPFRYGINSLLLNDRGQSFFDNEFLLGIEPRLGGRTSRTAFVLYCDGADKDHPGCEGMTGRTSVKGALSTRSSVLFDLDQDGDLDIVTNEFADRPMVLVSNLTDKKRINWCKVDLEGTRSNRDGIGAVVRITVNDRVWTQVNDGKSGYLGSSVIPLYFGLGDATQIDKIEVVWPSGTVQEVSEGLTSNSTLTIREPE